MDIPQIFSIKAIRKENSFINTYVFEGSLKSHPGQFINLWMPRVDEKPFSISYEDKGEFWITVFKVGAFTEKMFKYLKVGDKVGIRGPYGKGFKISKGSKVAAIGGGCGSAPLYFAVYEAMKNGCEVDFIAGARNKDYLFFLDEVKKITGEEVKVATDDGSLGCKGFNVELLKKAVKEKKYDLIITCGPEMMMKKVIEIADGVKVPVQISMERYMKCGLGICGQCVLDPEGLRVCKDGPVFTGEQVKKVKDFGEYFRDDVGRKVYFKKKV